MILSKYFIFIAHIVSPASTPVLPRKDSAAIRKVRKCKTRSSREQKSIIYSQRQIVVGMIDPLKIPVITLLQRLAWLQRSVWSYLRLRPDNEFFAAFFFQFLWI